MNNYDYSNTLLIS